MIIDTNTLVLFIVGNLKISLIESFSRLSAFNTRHYYYLLNEIQDAGNEVRTTSQVLTEADNLLHDRLPHGIKSLYHNYIKAEVGINILETSYTVRTALDSHSFISIGVTDSTILDLASPGDTVATTDLGLKNQLLAKNVQVLDLLSAELSHLQ